MLDEKVTHKEIMQYIFSNKEVSFLFSKMFTSILGLIALSGFLFHFGKELYSLFNVDTTLQDYLVALIPAIIKGIKVAAIALGWLLILMGTIISAVYTNLLYQNYIIGWLSDNFDRAKMSIVGALGGLITFLILMLIVVGLNVGSEAIINWASN